MSDLVNIQRTNALVNAIWVRKGFKDTVVTGTRGNMEACGWFLKQKEEEKTNLGVQSSIVITNLYFRPDNVKLNCVFLGKSKVDCSFCTANK